MTKLMKVFIEISVEFCTGYATCGRENSESEKKIADSKISGYDVDRT